MTRLTVTVEMTGTAPIVSDRRAAHTLWRLAYRGDADTTHN
jgi:hypothetical protein